MHSEQKRRPILLSLVFVICAHRNNLEVRTIGVTAPVVNHRSIRSRANAAASSVSDKVRTRRGIFRRPGNFRWSLFTGLDWRDLGSSSSSARGVRSGSQIDLGAREEASPFIASRCTSSCRVPATKVIFLDRYRATFTLSPSSSSSFSSFFSTPCTRLSSRRRRLKNAFPRSRCVIGRNVALACNL